MLTLMFLFSISMYMLGILSFCLKRKHLLVMLLNLEFIVVSLYFNLFIYLSLFNYEFYFSMIFLTLSVCEGALGLSVLVSLIRTHGNDYFQTFNVLW
uniref:NADH-ubiquinone oxidoreductase chain 4L n=1 Tax=Tropisternus sp. BYU-CO166 TaxID=696091 RepID=D8WKI1_9COLE|nr:NADH dehydrogenase subunit 4L [Tropisternus sp. BYU-CO166]ACZ58514.1 NADH dehydrogenase subunit 4L [Tropisternus sp. BYU-CO166]